MLQQTSVEDLQGKIIKGVVCGNHPTHGRIIAVVTEDDYCCVLSSDGYYYEDIPNEVIEDIERSMEGATA